MRLLVLCTHNSARSQMGEGWIRYWSDALGLPAEIFSAGTEATLVKPEAIEVMREAGVDISSHTSKTLFDLPDPWNFDVVLTVCDGAKEACPVYPAKTQRLHVSIPDPSNGALEGWRKVRDVLKWTTRYLVVDLLQGRLPSETVLSNVVGIQRPSSSPASEPSRIEASV
ncbi:arsenate reductase ArsC [Meiothermus granaticius]|nr:arsenate reductase ArsC [Meiothermus granaticius]